VGIVALERAKVVTEHAGRFSILNAEKTSGGHLPATLIGLE
jgi:hypothetical protein